MCFSSVVGGWLVGLCFVFDVGNGGKYCGQLYCFGIFNDVCVFCGVIDGGFVYVWYL